MQEDLTVSICKAAIDGVTTHDGNDVGILLGLVLPEDLRVIVEIECVDWVRERPMDVHDVAYHERPTFVATQNASRKRPCHLKFPDIIGGELLELIVALVCIISCLHHPIFWVLRHSDQLIVCMSGARSEDRHGPYASGEQEIAHRYPPCDSPRVTDAPAHALPRVGTLSMGKASGSVSQRNGGVGQPHFRTYAPSSFRGYVRISH